MPNRALEPDRAVPAWLESGASPARAVGSASMPPSPNRTRQLRHAGFLVSDNVEQGHVPAIASRPATT